MTRGPPPRKWFTDHQHEMDLASQLAKIRNEMEWQRLQVFRAYVGRRICLASPLLLDACRDSELDQVAWRARPSRMWPRRMTTHHTVRGWSTKGRTYRPVRVELVGAAGQAPVTVADQLVLLLTSRAAHMVLRLGSSVVRTHDDGGLLVIPGLLTSERCDELVGTALDSAFPHPLGQGWNYRLKSAKPDEPRRRTVCEFEVPPIEWRLPWARPWDVESF